jgi:hypothetical protein
MHGLSETSFRKRTPKDFGEAICDPEMRKPCPCWDDMPVCNLETWLPGGQLDFSSPYGSDQDQPHFWSRDAPASGEAQESVPLGGLHPRIARSRASKMSQWKPKSWIDTD